MHQKSPFHATDMINAFLKNSYQKAVELSTKILNQMSVFSHELAHRLDLKIDDKRKAV